METGGELKRRERGQGSNFQICSPNDKEVFLPWPKDNRGELHLKLDKLEQLDFQNQHPAYCKCFFFIKYKNHGGGGGSMLKKMQFHC